MIYDEAFKRALRFLPPGYDWRLLKAQCFQESSFLASVVSPAGAMGLMQIMPKTWEEWSKRAGHEGADPFDAVASIDTGACYMRWLLNQWHAERPQMDRALLAMASYNAGLGNVLKAQKAAGGANDYRTIMASLHEITGPRSCTETLNYGRSIFIHYMESVL